MVELFWQKYDFISGSWEVILRVFTIFTKQTFGKLKIIL